MRARRGPIGHGKVSRLARSTIAIFVDGDFGGADKVSGRDAAAIRSAADAPSSWCADRDATLHRSNGELEEIASIDF